ncbi:FCD domain-containing protein [Mycobacterium sp. UM_CSW]|uniref:FadR/GntR family transcriptional regulator n=1 Tax=Mycobacterium sp. UM_CSW TaxID=1370119 RepID=UPI0008349514|nr:FCD domain-containing protein [Mycobacterium sp. UM_CSW]
MKVPKAGELVAAKLRRQIVMGDIDVGDALPSEATLMTQFGVSRPTLREAFRILESEQLIEVLRGARGGARARRPDPGAAGRYTGALLQSRGTTLDDVYQARAALEESAIGLASGRGLSRQIRELEELSTRGAGLIEDPAAYAEFDVVFHHSIMALAGNTTLSVLADQLYSIIEAHNRAHLADHPAGYDVPACRTHQRGHNKLVRLLIEGDLEGAQRHWRRHLDGVQKYMIEDSRVAVVDVLSAAL